MIAVLVGNDDVGRVTIVELVEFEPSVEYRHVPLQKVDEDALAILEHRPQPAVAAGLRASAFDDDPHPLVSPIREQASRGPAGGGITQMVGGGGEPRPELRWEGSQWNMGETAWATPREFSPGWPGEG